MPDKQSSRNENGSNDRKDFEPSKPDQEGRDTSDTSISAEDSDTIKKEATKGIHADSEDLAKVMYGTQSFGV